jgi:hypothetical protein
LNTTRVPTPSGLARCVLQHRLRRRRHRIAVTNLSPIAARSDSIVFCVGFLTGVLRLGAILVSGLPVLVSGATVSLGEVVGQRFRGRLMFLCEQLVHGSYLILALSFCTVGFRGLVVGLLAALGGSLNIRGGGTTPRRPIGAAIVGGP